MERVSVTQAELIAALQAAADRRTEDPEGALTVADLSENLGWSDKIVRRELRKLMKTDRLETVKVLRETIAGHSTHVPAYRVLVEDENSSL
jgi:predicted ArsR family transcriptional regulator